MQLQNLDTLFVGKVFIELKEVDSTNTFLMDLCKEQTIFEGTTVFAHRQRNGRGQRGNLWWSEEDKNIVCSIFFMPEFMPAEDQFQLNKAVSLAVCETVKKFVPHKSVKIKWPNDIYIDDKKAGGILIENLLKGKNMYRSVIGIGLNVNQTQFPEQLKRATSLKREGNNDLSVEEILTELLAGMERRYLQVRARQTKTIDADYLKELYMLNRDAAFMYNNKLTPAKITGISKEGKLQLLSGDLQKIECGIKEIEFVSGE